MGSSSQPIDCISAVTLVTTDMVASVAFYDALGFELHYGGAEAAFTSYQVGSGHLNLQAGDLHAGDRDRPPLWGRIIFWVDDVDAMYQRARQAGFEPSTAPADASWGERYFHLSDPDGHELSFARPLDTPDKPCG